MCFQQTVLNFLNMNPDPARAVRQDSPVYTHTFSAWCPNVDFWLAFSLSDIMVGFLG